VLDRLSEQIATLPSLNKTQLLAIWGKNFSKDPPPNLRKELMVPILAYRMQEREFGGLSHSARRRLREVAVSLRTDKPSQEKPDSAPQIGTRLLRVWRGETHEVIATGNGYEYRGQTYSSLSRIAREITGTRWSGPLFFGVRKP
jgi:Protein of unknown function (DUF2924)